LRNQSIGLGRREAAPEALRLIRASGTGRSKAAAGGNALMAARSKLPGLAGIALAMLFCIGQPSANQTPRFAQLTSADVTRILQQAVVAARSNGTTANVAVVDRVGNVLAVYRMFGATTDIKVTAGRPVQKPSGLVGLQLPFGSFLAAPIAKAITGAYLSSGGNAFTTRTASQIIQENFNPLSTGLEGGPLFGVQFSQLPCSDLSVRFATNNTTDPGLVSPTLGPKRSPLGFAADPGGLPLYKDGTLVGGVGVFSDGIYGLARSKDASGGNDESIALAATTGFGPPERIKANRIFVDGRGLTFSNASAIGAQELANSGSVDLLAAGFFVPVRGYYDGSGPLTGQAFGFGQSGFRPDSSGQFGTNQAYVLADAAGANRYPPVAGSRMTAAEVRQILRSALGVALQSRAQIRQPLGSFVEVTISVVDIDGRILGIVRTPDAPVFGTDVSLQKARSTVFFSSASAFNILRTLPPSPQGITPGSYFLRMQQFTGQRLAGWYSFAARSIGNLGRPFYPDGVNGRRPGPLSRPFPQWSPFNTGLQFDLVFGGLVQHVLFVTDPEGDAIDVGASCVDRLQNGLQIFSGGVPIFRGQTIVGGVGVSGDGIDQDDMVSFLGLERAARTLRTGIAQAPKPRRADRLSPSGANLRWVQCPFTPFNGSNDQSVCKGI
jgi:uncharacterized protein GlcG (DUF336 family)